MAAVSLAFVSEEEPDVPVERLRRPRTMGIERLSKRELAEKERIDSDLEMLAALAARPRVRGDCKDGPRPCPWVGCSMHLALNLTPYGAPKVMFPGDDGGVDFDVMEETCALDVADVHDDPEPKKYAEVGRLMNMTPQRAEQIEAGARLKGRVELAVPASRSRVGREGRPERPGRRPHQVVSRDWRACLLAYRSSVEARSR